MSKSGSRLGGCNIGVRHLSGILFWTKNRMDMKPALIPMIVPEGITYNFKNMARRTKILKLNLFLLFLALSLCIVFLHYKFYQRNDELTEIVTSSEDELTEIVTEKVTSDCSCEAKGSELPERHRFILDNSVQFKVCETRPSSGIEQTRRHILETARYQWLFLFTQINSLKNFISKPSAKTKAENIMKYILDHAKEFSSVIEAEVGKLGNFDGWNDWRKKEDNELKKIVHKKIIKLQNPRNCSEISVFICKLDNPYGFASGIHDALWCFIKAFSLEHRLVVEVSNWHYAPGGWDTLFKPLSETCGNDSAELQKQTPWPGNNGNSARWLLRTIPQSLSERMIRLYGNPLAWWYGQFMSYLMRPSDQLNSFIKDSLESVNFTKTYVGIHIRRSDKVKNEAKDHGLYEYIEHAEKYFQSLELVSTEKIQRRVYIATDEPNVLTECVTHYPEYECLYNPGVAEIAKDLKSRYTNESIWNLMVDIFALVQSDYIVCTMSSGLCRVAYELKMSMDKSSIDASGKITSLDIPHHYAHILPASRSVIYNHKPKSPKEISILKGDVLDSIHDMYPTEAARAGKSQDGFMKMKKKEKGQKTEGCVPIYKTREIFQMFNFSVR